MTGVRRISRITYYVALPFIPTEDGGLAPGRPVEASSADAAIWRAAGLAKWDGRAVAFSRTGDPDLGEFEPAVILAKYGELPRDLPEL